MPKNNPVITSAVRSPRSLIKLNGMAYAPISWEANNNSFYQADTFRAVLALPTPVAYDPFPDAAEITAEIFVGFPPNPAKFTVSDLTSIFYGIVDDIDSSPTARSIEINGRDLSGRLIDDKTSEKFVGKTASDIATKFASDHGLTPVVTKTTTDVGRLYDDAQSVRLQDENTDWDLLTWLAREEGFVAYVQGRELHFEPQPDENQDPYVFQWDETSRSFNGAQISMSRSMTLAKDISVTVSSTNLQTGKVVHRTASRQHKKTGAGGVQKYARAFPGLDDDGAQKRAESIADELSKHERVINIEGPADNLLLKTDVIQLKGTNSGWDQTYHPAQIVRTFDGDGYRWRIMAKNHDTDSEPTL